MQQGRVWVSSAFFLSWSISVLRILETLVTLEGSSLLTVVASVVLMEARLLTSVVLRILLLLLPGTHLFFEPLAAEGLFISAGRLRMVVLLVVPHLVHVASAASVEVEVSPQR